MAFKSIILALAASQAVNAHFKLAYPEWRADTLAAENDDKYSQWNYPCTPLLLLLLLHNQVLRLCIIAMKEPYVR